MSEKKAEGIGFFQKYLTLWVGECIINCVSKTSAV